MARTSQSAVRDEYPCRFCGKATDLFVTIWEGEGLQMGLETKIARHLPVHLAADDGFPQTLCFVCVDMLDTWDRFVTMCVDRDASFRADSAKNDSVYVQDVYMPDHWDENSFSESDDQPLILAFKPATDEKNQETELEPVVTEKSRRKKGIPKRFQREGLDSEKVMCPTCGKEFKDRKYFAKHETVCGVKQKRNFPCKMCGHLYKSRANLVRHIDREHLSDQEVCPVCQLPVSRKKMTQHLKNEHSIKREKEQFAKFKCKFCSEWFTNKYTRNEHLKKVHTEQEQVKCESCDFEGLRHIVKRHVRSVHSEKRFPCALCTNAFKTLHMLKMHMTAHSDMRCYTCDVCGMGFKRLNNVRDHMKCHQKKSNQCQICGNFFARKRYLTVHEQTIHNHYADGVVPEEKGFECGTCGAKLKWKKNLLAHMRIHTGEKPYDCKICHRGFVCHGSLRAHMSKHSIANESVLLAPDDPLSIEISVLSHFNQSLQIPHHA